MIARHGWQAVETEQPEPTRPRGDGWGKLLVGLVTAALTCAAAFAPLYISARNTITSLHRTVNAQQSTIQEQRHQLAAQHPTVPNAPEGGHFLADVNPVADNLNVEPGPVVIGGVDYANSITMSCFYSAGPGELYRVTGTQFTAVVGISDGQAAASASSGNNVTDTVTFADQNGHILGRRVNVSGGHPLRVKLDLSGVNELGISCIGRDTVSGSTDVAAPALSLGNAATS